MASIIMAYGVVLSVLGLGVRSLAPEVAKIAFIAGLAGGGLCVFCGMAAWVGHKRRVWTILTLAVVTLVLLSQTVNGWMDSPEKAGAIAGPLLYMCA